MWMRTHLTHSYFSAHAYYYVIVWMRKNMLNEKDFIGMCNDVTSRSIIQNKSYHLTLFKGIEHLWHLITLRLVYSRFSNIVGYRTGGKSFYERFRGRWGKLYFNRVVPNYLRSYSKQFTTPGTILIKYIEKKKRMGCKVLTNTWFSGEEDVKKIKPRILS